MSNKDGFVSDLENSDYGIVETMTRKDFEDYFKDNQEIFYKNLTVGIMDWDNGTYDVLTPEDNEDGFKILNKAKFTNINDARKFAVDYLVDYDKNRNSDGSLKEEKKTSKKKTVKKEVYNGPRTVKVFSRDIYIEENPKATNEQIRMKLVNDYGFSNFTKDKVSFEFDSASGILEVFLKFNVKG